MTIVGAGIVVAGRPPAYDEYDALQHIAGMRRLREVDLRVHALHLPDIEETERPAISCQTT